jgi:hypothetical protein
MFVPLASPEAATASELRALRLSLNSPVVKLASLPVGPASAAIALHDALDGPRVTVALRSERGGELRLFAPEDPPGPGADPEDLLDAALSFAERMGFLFDDDEVETRGEAGPREAAGIWLRFAGLAEPAGSGPAPPASAADPGPALPLTKFRQRIGEAGAARPADARVLLLGRF